MSMKTSRFTEELKAVDTANPPPPPIESDNGRGKGETPAFDPRYRFPRPWWDRLFGAGCAGCGGKPPGWLQRQIQTPKRTMRLILWLANLLPRGVSLWTALTGGRTSGEVYDERQAMCSTCPDAVIHLRLLKATIHEKSYCGACNCPKWWLARLDIKNRLHGWRCPKRRHAGSDIDAAYRVYALGKAAGAQRVATAASGIAGGSSTGNGG